MVKKGRRKAAVCLGDRFRSSAKTLDSGDYQILKLAVMVEKQTVRELTFPAGQGEGPRAAR